MALRKDVLECVPNPDPLARPDYTEAEAHAIRALRDGVASDRQQKMALDFMIRAFGTYDTSFRPDNQYLSAFAEGRRHAGTTLIWMLNAAPTRTDPDKIATRMINNPDSEGRN